MKKTFALLLAIISLCVLSACGKSYRYGGLDASGNDATVVIKSYYELKKANAEPESYYPLYSQHRLNVVTSSNFVYEDLTLLDFTHCEIVDESQISKSDLTFIEENKDEYYAFCYVQTADKVYCNEDCATGLKDETVNRTYMYCLVMENENSDWKIYDYGYPPFYIPE